MRVNFSMGPNPDAIRRLKFTESNRYTRNINYGFDCRYRVLFQRYFEICLRAEHRRRYLEWIEISKNEIPRDNCDSYYVGRKYLGELWSTNKNVLLSHFNPP